MKRVWRLGLMLGCIAGLFGSACSRTHWTLKEAREDFHLPRRITIYVVMSDELAEGDPGWAAALVDALERDLRERRYAVEIRVYRKDEAPPVPRIELQIVSSKRGKGPLHGAGTFDASATPTEVAGSIPAAVDCYVVLDAGAKPAFQGRIKPDWYRGYQVHDAAEAGERVGLRIAATLAD